ncbi:MAG: hypothetical protein GY866_22025 [Proteobacteria bacterium]|nr:hypothetical protein [Pseudomonadota bacterium]
MQGKNGYWKPLAEDKLAEIRALFADLYAENEFPGLAVGIADYWIEKLRRVWNDKSRAVKDKDQRFKPSDPLSRIRQKTVVISYADSVNRRGEKSLATLDTFLGKHFPAVGGLHMLPACSVAEGRFNDGYFSQVERDRIHHAFGSNETFSEMTAKYYSMADFVLNHVDIDNPSFQAYLDGDDEKGECFFVLSEEEYQQRLANGDYAQIFRPRPFPLFTIFRRNPQNDAYRQLSHEEKTAEINRQFEGKILPEAVVGLLSVFNKIKNDQMLLDQDYRHIVDFRNHLADRTAVDPDQIFKTSAIQETQHTPYIFVEGIDSPADLLEAVGYDSAAALEYARTLRHFDDALFGQEIRALTTFSHVQVDLNTATLPGLKMLANDFSWYLGLDLDMLRLDAANFAFKKWKTTCFGLPEVSKLMKILYLSIDCVSPRIVANLEVNDQLSAVLTQMADKNAPPPMMYDFHLACLLPVVFNTGQAEILSRIFMKIAEFDIPRESIRFSLAESHDGKSVRGSLDLLTLAERQMLADTVEQNRGRVKYKSVPERQYPVREFQEVCQGAGLDFETAKRGLFKPRGDSDPDLYLNDNLDNEEDLAKALAIDRNHLSENDTLKFFVNKILHGREPYELCVSTRDSLAGLDDEALEIDRYLAFYTLAFALMGRNVKSIYFNDLLGLPNDYERFKESGELRDLKRTKSDVQELENRLANTASATHKIAVGINHIIALVDADPALHFRGNEAQATLSSGAQPPKSVAVVYNSCEKHHTLVVVNVDSNTEKVAIDLERFGLSGVPELVDNIAGQTVSTDQGARLALTVRPFQRLWLTKDRMEIL